MMRTTTLDLVCLTALAAGVVYFSVDAWFGPSGWNEQSALRSEVQRLESEIAGTEAQRAVLEARIRALSGPEIDPDLLDERLRAAMGVIGDRDVLLIAPGRPAP